jgi:S-adenosyl methyltransferase
VRDGGGWRASSLASEDRGQRTAQRQVTRVALQLDAHLVPDLIPRLVDAPGDQASYTFIPRTRRDLSRFFQGLELIEPGVAPMSRWLPSNTDPTIAESADIYYYCAIGRKP